MKRKLVSILSILICLCLMLTSCGSNNENIGGVAHNYDMIISSPSDVKCDYLLVYPKDANYAELTAYVDLLESLSKAGSIIFQLAPDNLKVPKATQKTILLGSTSYSESLKASNIVNSLRINNYYDYLIHGFENKIALVWKSTSGRTAAFEKLLQDFPSTITQAFSPDYSFMHIDSADNYPIFTVADVPITDYQIVKPKNCSYFITQAVDELAATVFTATGKTINVVDDSAEEVKYEVLIGNTNRGQSAITDLFAETKYAIVEHGDKLVVQGGRTETVVKCVNTLNDMILQAYQTARPVNFKENEYMLGNMNGETESLSNGYNLVYSENFSGEFNEKVFNKVQKYQNYYGSIDSGMNYLKNHVDNEDGRLELFVTTDAEGYSGGHVTTKNKLMLQYGYIEIAAKIQAFPGVWSRAYLYCEDSENGKIKQIDIFNCFDNGESVFATASSIESLTYDQDWIKQYENHHDKLFINYINGKPALEEPEGEDNKDNKKDNKKENKTEDKKEDTGLIVKQNFADEYHLFGVEWTDEYIRFTVDGKEYGTIDTSGPAYNDLKDKMYLVFEINVNMSATQIDRESVEWPVILSIENIDIYQRKEVSEFLIGEQAKQETVKTESEDKNDDKKENKK